VADEIAAAYMRWVADGDPRIKGLCSPDFLDHVSGRAGHEIFDVVDEWFDVSFADRRVEHHATAIDGDRVLVWFTMHARHVGNGLPRLADLPINDAVVAWPQLHVLRVRGDMAVEHWAVRDDFGLVEQIKAAGSADG
jgi:hypothetical protein